MYKSVGIYKDHTGRSKKLKALNRDKKEKLKKRKEKEIFHIQIHTMRRYKHLKLVT